MKKFKLDMIFDSLNDAIMSIVEHFLYLNNLLLTFQKDQKLFQQEYQQQQQLQSSIYSKKGGFEVGLFDTDADDDMISSSANFITLKQSNEVLKEFHSLTSTLVVLVTSIKNL